MSVRRHRNMTRSVVLRDEKLVKEMSRPSECLSSDDDPAREVRMRGAHRNQSEDSPDDSKERAQIRRKKTLCPLN